MRKTILSLTLLLTLLSHAQDLWTETCLFPDQRFVPLKISIANNNTIWMCGADYLETQNSTQVWWRSTDSGVTWEHGNIDLGHPDLYIHSISGISDDTAYVSAGSGSLTSNGGVWVTNDAGIHWTRQLTYEYHESGTISDTNVYFWDAQNGVSMGNPEGNQFEIYTTNNSGTTWERVSAAQLPSALPNEKGRLVCNDPRGNCIWFSTNKDRLFKSNDKGLSWSATQSPMPESEIGRVAFKNENDGIFANFKTTDGGQTWNDMNSPFSQYYYEFYTAVPGTSGTYFSWGTAFLDLARGSSYSVDNGISYTFLNDTEERPVEVFYAIFKSNTIGYCFGAWADSFHFFKLNSNAFHRLMKTESNTFPRFSNVPNPANNIVNISGNKIKSVTILDFSGKKILNQNYPVSDDVVLDISKLQSGIYLAEVTTDSGTSSTIKILKN